MELSEKEKMLIEAIREMDEVPYNILLWYVSGRQESLKKLENAGLDDKYIMESDNRKIDIARSYMREM